MQYDTYMIFIIKIQEIKIKKMTEKESFIHNKIYELQQKKVLD